MPPADNIALVRRLFEEGIIPGKLDLIDELIARDCPLHALWFNPVTPSAVSPTISTPEMMKAALTMERTLFPDLRVTIDEMLDAGDRVVVRWTQQGTYKNGERVTWQGLEIYRISDRQVVERWEAWDRLGFWQQLGIVPSTDQLLQKAGL